MKLFYSALLLTGLAALAGCASYGGSGNIAAGMSENEVNARAGQPAASGRLANGEEYRDYSTQPFGFTISRVTFTPDGRVRDVRNLLTEENYKNLQLGMTPEQVLAVVGPSPSYEQRSYAGGTKSWTYRYRDYEVVKLLHVIYGADDRLQYWYTEWDPKVYSKGDGKDGGSGK